MEGKVMRLTFYGKDLLNDISISIEASSEKDAYSRLSDLLGGGNTHSICDRYSVEYECDMSDMQQPINQPSVAKDQKPKKWIVEKLSDIDDDTIYDSDNGWYILASNACFIDECYSCARYIENGESVYWDGFDGLYCINCAANNGAPPLYTTTGWRAYYSDGHLDGSFHVAGEELARKLAKDNGGRLVRLIKRVA
jgi:hypothetical protein